MAKKYPCEVPGTKRWKLCRYGGNKYFNYGFFQGTAGYCRKVKRWTNFLKTCPLQV